VPSKEDESHPDGAAVGDGDGKQGEDADSRHDDERGPGAVPVGGRPDRELADRPAYEQHREDAAGDALVDSLLCHEVGGEKGGQSLKREQVEGEAQASEDDVPVPERTGESTEHLGERR